MMPAVAAPPLPPPHSPPRQLSARRVADTLRSLGWDVSRFEARYRELDPDEPAAPSARGVRRGLLSAAQAAKRLGLHRRTVLKYAQEGKLGSYRRPGSKAAGNRYRFDAAQLDEFRRTYWHLLPAEAPEEPA